MHPRQASVSAEARALAARVSRRAGIDSVQPSGAALLWKYQDAEGNVFYLETKKTTVKSPFSGKSFSARPERFTPAQVGKEMKEERKEKTAGSPGWDEDDAW